ncbi:MAG: hypothetical protein LBD98_03730 [Endomicrobium sp.]|jgi:hypothetical protein|nr:hypothetical protein [Endomicrobium sp.]
MSPLLTHPNKSFPLPRQIKLPAEEEKWDPRDIEILKYHRYRYLELPKEEVAQLESEKGWETLHINIKYLNFPRYFVLPQNDDGDPPKGFSTTCPAN